MIRSAPNDDHADRVIHMIYGTLGERGLWPGVLDEICDAFGGSGVGLIEHNFGNRKGFFWYKGSRVPASVERAYNSRMCARNPWLRSDLPYQPEAALLGTEILPNTEVIGTEFYLDYLRPQGWLHRICGVVARDGLQVQLLTILRPEGMKPFGENDKKGLQRILPHLRQALDLRKHLREDRSEREALLEILDHMPVACLLVNRGARVRFLNKSAEQLLARRDGLMVQADCLIAGTSRESIRLRKMIGRVATGQSSAPRGPGEHMVISRPSERPPLLLTCFWVHRSENGRPGGGEGLVALLTKDPDGESLESLDSFAAAYHLTRAEGRLVGLLAEGRGVFEAASELGVTKNTARTHMKHIYSKVGTHRQTDIIRLLAKLGMS